MIDPPCSILVHFVIQQTQHNIIHNSQFTVQQKHAIIPPSRPSSLDTTRIDVSLQFNLASRSYPP